MHGGMPMDPMGMPIMMMGGPMGGPMGGFGPMGMRPPMDMMGGFGGFGGYEGDFGGMQVIFAFVRMLASLPTGTAMMATHSGRRSCRQSCD